MECSSLCSRLRSTRLNSSVSRHNIDSFVGGVRAKHNDYSLENSFGDALRTGDFTPGFAVNSLRVVRCLALFGSKSQNSCKFLWACSAKTFDTVGACQPDPLCRYADLECRGEVISPGVGATLIASSGGRCRRHQWHPLTGNWPGGPRNASFPARIPVQDESLAC